MSSPRSSLGAPYRMGWCGPREAESLSPGELRAWLHSDELAELDAISSEKRRRDRLSGRLAAKRALIAHFQQTHGWEPEPLELLIVNDEFGRPRLRLASDAPAEAPCFSLSHSSSGAAAAAAAPGLLVGVDLEQIVPRPQEVLAFAAAPDELGERLLADPVRQAKLWTGKEAALKLLGLGLDADPRSIEIGPDGSVRLSGTPEKAWRALGAPELAVDFIDRGGALAAVAHSGGRNHG